MDNIPLSEVIKFLDDQARKRDPDGLGINFILAPHAGTVGHTDPSTGLPAAAWPELVEMGDIGITIRLALHDIRLADFLDVIVRDVRPADQLLDRGLWRGLFNERARSNAALLPRHQG